MDKSEKRQQKRDLHTGVDEFISSFRFGEAETHGNLTVIPVFAGAASEDGYVLLDEGLETRKVLVEEISEGGSVPELLVKNGLTDLDLLLLQGDLLIGAKQNRTVNATLVVPRKTTMKIPVSCVEQGRWHYQGRHFRASKSHLHPSLRKKSHRAVSESLKASAGRSYQADQSAVWEDIHAKSGRMHVSSPTSSMEDIYETREQEIEALETKFTLHEGQTGFVAAISGKIVGCEAFGSRSILPRVYRKILRGYILDAIDSADVLTKKGAAPGKGPRDWQRSARRFLDKAAAMKRENYKSLGAGTEARFEDKSSSGSALLDDKGQVVHLAVFA